MALPMPTLLLAPIVSRVSPVLTAGIMQYSVQQYMCVPLSASAQVLHRLMSIMFKILHHLGSQTSCTQFLMEALLPCIYITRLFSPFPPTQLIMNQCKDKTAQLHNLIIACASTAQGWRTCA